MFETDQHNAIVREWVLKAENNLRAAVQMLGAKKPGPFDAICFHAQQGVEKYLKALLVWRKVDFPKIHDAAEIIALLPPRMRPALEIEEARRLAQYATVTRYPGDYEPITLAEAKKALALARRIRRDVRRHLPKTALK